MKRALLSIFLALPLTSCGDFGGMLPAFAETVTPPVAAAPVLSPSQQIALHDTDLQEDQLRQQYQQLERQRQAVLSEFSSSHPGWHVDPRTAAVVHDAPAPAPKPAKK